MNSGLRDLLLKAHRFAISAHNVQPFQFHFADQQVQIYVDPKRHLPAADPHEKDLRMSLGALLQTWNIALSEKGFLLKIVGQAGDSHQQQTPYAIFVLEKTNEGKSDLLSIQPERFSYRGGFSELENDMQARLKKNLIDCGLRVITEQSDKKEIAKLYNEINLRSMLKPGYIEELYSWLRFDQTDSHYYRDGLNKESLSLHGIEALGAAIVMKPKVFRFLDQMGVAGVLVDEASKIISAPFLVGIVCSENNDDIERGQIFYNKWLELTRLQLFGAPLSLLTDDSTVLRQLCQLFQLQKGETLANVIRCGVLPDKYCRHQTARLQNDELIWRK